MCRISVIIPVYNGSQGITTCLDSIFGQTYQNLELIIIDDGSTDDSVQKIELLLQENQNPQIPTKLICQKNQGVANTRNLGIKTATGKYIGFVDQDDIIAPEYFQNYLESAEKTKADVVVGGYQRTTTTGKIKKRVQLHGYDWEKFVVLSPWAHLYQREFLLKHNIKFLSGDIGEDVYFNLLAYSHTKKVDVISDTSYNWIYNTHSVSNSKQNIISDKVNPIRLLNAIVGDIPNQKFLHSEIVEYYFARYVCWYMLFACRGSQKTDIDSMLKQLLEWLQAHYPNYSKNRYLHFHRPQGEPIPISLSVQGFYFLQRMGLLSPFLKSFGVDGKKMV